MMRAPVDCLTDEPAPGSRSHWRVGAVVRIQAAISLGYGLLVIGLTAFPQQFGGAAVRWWIRATGSLTQGLLVLVPDPADLVGSENAAMVAIYRHLLAFSLIIACGTFMVFFRNRPQWAARANAGLDRLSLSHGCQAEIALIGHVRMVQGLVATLVILLYGERWWGQATAIFYTELWTFLRAPLLTTLAFAFACHAATFRLCLSSRGQSVTITRKAPGDVVPR